MPFNLHNATDQPSVDPNEASRTASLHSVKHSPDGYFAHDELVHAWQSLTAPDPANIRSRSRTQVGLSHAGPHSVLQDVAEDETSDPHAWRSPSKTDSRGPCPALGALSNHGYLPHDGRNISIWKMVQALREGYGGSLPFALGLTIVSYVILRLGGVGKGWLWPTIDLEDLGAHGVLEHDGSLAHADVDEDEATSSQDNSRSHSRTGSLASSTVVSAAATHSTLSLATQPALPTLTSRARALLALASRLPIISHFVRTRTHVYAPTQASRKLIHELFADSASSTHLTLADVARARVRREACSRPIPSRIIQQFADGEFAMTIDIIGHDGRIELDVLRAWLEEERLPHGWVPSHVQGLWRTHVMTSKVQALMAGLRRYRTKGKDVQSVLYE